MCRFLWHTCVKTKARMTCLLTLCLSYGFLVGCIRLSVSRGRQIHWHCTFLPLLPNQVAQMLQCLINHHRSAFSCMTTVSKPQLLVTARVLDIPLIFSCIIGRGHLLCTPRLHENITAVVQAFAHIAMHEPVSSMVIRAAFRTCDKFCVGARLATHVLKQQHLLNV